MFRTLSAQPLAYVARRKQNLIPSIAVHVLANSMDVVMGFAAILHMQRWCSEMRNKVLWLRITLWWGILADAIETVRMSVPRLFVASTGIDLAPDVGFRFGLLYGVPVRLGWTLLLFWASRKPLERKGVVLCLIPVVAAYIAVEIAGISMGIVLLAKTVPTLVLQALLLGLCVFGHANAWPAGTPDRGR